MKNKYALVAVIAAALASAAFVFGAEMGSSIVVAKGDLKWKEMNSAGVAAAPVSGDMAKGPCRFFLKYPAGLVTPLHHHSSEHHVAVVSGTITLTVGGKDYRLGPGSYFMLGDKAPHVAKVEGKEDAIFFIESEGPWDVVMAK
jgi:mannose-6-phosphate isomerase-like protein (cupin superfamily)